MAVSEPIRNKKHIKNLIDYYVQKNEIRNYLLIVMGIHTALRISDMLNLRWTDIYDCKKRQYKKRLYLVEKKTGKDKTIAINKHILDALELYRQSLKDVSPETFIFHNNRKSNKPISRVQAYRLIKGAAKFIGIKENTSCHSLRKTFGYHAWKNHIPIPVIMDIYNHSSFDITKRYLGICQDDRDKAYLQMTFY